MPIVEILNKNLVSNAQDKLENAYKRTVEVLSNVIRALNDGNLEATENLLLRQLFQRYFLNDNIINEDKEFILEVLLKTYKGLTENDITIDIKYFNFVSSKENIINLAVAQINNEKQAIRYLIHEASHLYAGTKDFGDSGYINNDGAFRMMGIDAVSAINNADSYGCLAVLFNEIELV